MECFGVSGLRPGWSHQTKESRILVSSMRVYSKGCTRGRPREAGKTVDHKGCWGSHVRNLTFACVSAGCLSRVCACVRSVSLKARTGCLANQNERQGSNTME